MRKLDYKNTFKCDKCKITMNKEQTVFTETSYGGKAWLCVKCGREEGITSMGGSI